MVQERPKWLEDTPPDTEKAWCPICRKTGWIDYYKGCGVNVPRYFSLLQVVSVPCSCENGEPYYDTEPHYKENEAKIRRMSDVAVKQNKQIWRMVNEWTRMSKKDIYYDAIAAMKEYYGDNMPQGVAIEKEVKTELNKVKKPETTQPPVKVKSKDFLQGL